MIKYDIGANLIFMDVIVSHIVDGTIYHIRV
jgi:hypothetical protein